MARFQNTRQPDWGWWGRLWPAPGETLREFGVETGDALLEVGSGNGYFALPAARITEPAPVYAVDIDETLLEELSELADLHAIDNLRPIHGDARQLAQQVPGPVDVVLVANTFHGIAEPTPFVEQVFDVLRPGGRFIVVNWQPVPKEETPLVGEPRGPPTELRLSPDDTTETILEASSFDLIDSIELPPYHYALIFER